MVGRIASYRRIIMPTDAIQFHIAVGDIVNIPGAVTAIGGTPTAPTVTITTKYKGFDGNTDVVGPVDIIQVIKDN